MATRGIAAAMYAIIGHTGVAANAYMKNRMLRTINLVGTAVMIAFFACQFPNSPAVAAEGLPTDKQCVAMDNPDKITKGWCTSINRSKGDCLACHTMAVDPWPESLTAGGNIAQPLAAIKQRFPEKAKLRAQIWDATRSNPRSVMPPFGRHKILTEDEIDNIVGFLLTI